MSDNPPKEQGKKLRSFGFLSRSKQKPAAPSHIQDVNKSDPEENDGKLPEDGVYSLGESNNPTYRGEVISKLTDDEHKYQVKRAFEAFAQLPAGEVARLADTATKKVENWPDSIPKIAPELYRKRPADEELHEFLERVYSNPGYLNGTLTTAHLDIIDPPLAAAVRGFIKKHGALPKHIKLPNKVERPTGLKYNRK